MAMPARHQLASHRSRRLMAAAIAAMMLAACTGGTGDPEPTGQPDATSVSTPEGPPPTEAVPAGEGPVQDVWVYERVRTIADDGSFADVTSALLDSVADDLGEPVELRDGVTFRPAPTLDPVVLDTPGVPRDDLDVVAGVVATDHGRRLQVVATPTGSTSVDGDDTLALDLSGVDGLAAGDPLVVDFTFGQALPAADDSEDELDALEQLAARMRGQRFQWYGVEGEDGTRSPGLLRVFGSVPKDVGTAAAAPASGAPAVTLAVARPGPADRDRGRARVHLAQAGGGLAGGVPLKAQPTVKPVDDLAGCDDSSIDCLKDYFNDMEDGFRKSLEDIFDVNMGPDPFPDPPPTPDCQGACGGGSGEPHMKTFDRMRYDLQAVGEFVLASSDALTVQMRTIPWGDDRRVSVIGGIAVELGDQRVTVQVDREVPIHVDGDPLPIAEARQGVELDAGHVAEYGGDLYVTTDAGPTVTVHGAASGSSLDVVVATEGTAAGAWTGLLGDADGNPDDDRAVRGGDVLPVDLSPDRLYDEFAESWRITDEESLFDYGPGESTTTYTDRSYPDEHVTLDDLPDDAVARARTLCTNAGIARPAQLDACVFDVALTGDVRFVRSARHASARLDPVAGDWTRQLPTVDELAGQAFLDGVGHVVVPGTSDDSGEVTALDLATGEVAWQVAAARTAAGCVAPLGGEAVAVLVPGEDGTLALSVRDAEDGTERMRVPTPAHDCDAMVGTGTTVLLNSRGRLVVVDTAEETSSMHETVEPARGPLLAGDGTSWVVTADDGLRAVRLSPDGTTVDATVPLDGEGVLGRPTATSDGLLVRTWGPRPRTALQRVTPDGVTWQTTFPRRVGDVEVDELDAGELAVNGGHAATYVSGDQVGVFDLQTGRPVTSVDSSSFNNNGGRVHLLPDAVVVGPFGGDHWVEALAIDDGTRAWSIPAPSALEVHDVKMVGPTTPSGQVVVATRSSNGIVVAKVGPGS